MSENKYVEELTEEERCTVSSMECTHPTGCSVNGNLFTIKLVRKKKGGRWRHSDLRKRIRAKRLEHK